MASLFPGPYLRALAVGEVDWEDTQSTQAGGGWCFLTKHYFLGIKSRAAPGEAIREEKNQGSDSLKHLQEQKQNHKWQQHRVIPDWGPAVRRRVAEHPLNLENRNKQTQESLEHFTQGTSQGWKAEQTGQGHASQEQEEAYECEQLVKPAASEGRPHPVV